MEQPEDMNMVSSIKQNSDAAADPLKLDSSVLIAMLIVHSGFGYPVGRLASSEIGGTDTGKYSSQN